MKLEVGYKSVPGSSHPYEDRILIDKERCLFAVADGVTISSQGSGGVAAEIAISEFSRLFAGDILKTLHQVNSRIVKLKLENKSIGETTFTVAYFSNYQAHVANVGDSPAFIVRQDKLEQLTRSDRSPLGGLLQVIGLREEIHPYISRVSIEKNDVFLLASDGISHILDEETVVPLVKNLSKTSQIADKLVSLADHFPSGYDDDKSVIVIKIVEK